MSNTDQLSPLVANVVSAYLGNNTVPVDQIETAINSITRALTGTPAPAQAETVTETPVETPAPDPLVPAVSVRKSVTKDYLICLEDGKKFKTLKRHLRVAFGMTPDQYRAKWNLPADYPMTAENYSAVRSERAKAIGLGSVYKRNSKPAVTEGSTQVVSKAPKQLEAA